MRYVKWIFWVVVLAVVFAFFHYTLPQRDVVRVTGTEIIRMDFSRWNRMFFAQKDSGNVEGTNRDLRLINTVYPDGKVMVFRNEDTGFGWPPYFKLDSSNLQAEAADAVSTRDAPQWAVLTHYGWRNEFLTIFPNALSIREIDNPDDIGWIPWLNVIIFVIFGLFALGFYRLTQRFKRRKIDPLVEKMEDRWDQAEVRAAQASDNMDAARGSVSGWFRRWFGSSK